MHRLSKTVSMGAIFTAALLGCGGSSGSGSGAGGGGGSTTGIGTGAGGTTGTGGSTGTGGGTPSGDNNYQPLTVGSTWTYQVTDSGIQTTKTNVVEAQEDEGG